MLQKMRRRKSYRAHPSLRLPVHKRFLSRKNHRPALEQQEFDFHKDGDRSQTSTRDILTDKLIKSAPVAVVSALIGLSIAMAMSGVVNHLQMLYVPRGFVIGAILGGSLMALSVGVGVPQRFAMWICISAWRRFVAQGKPSEMSNMLIHPDIADRPLYWMVLSVIALMGGLAAALLPMGLYFCSSIYDWLQAHFVWSSVPLELLHIGISFVVTLVPLGLLGIALSCVHHLSCPYGRWETLATGWLLIGAAVGCWMGEGLSTSMLLVASSLPAFLVTLIATGVSSSRHFQLARPRQDAATWLPLRSDRWGGSLRASIVAVGGGSACGLLIWVGELQNNISTSTVLFEMLCSLGVGVLVACKTKKAGLRSVGGFGVACATAGIVVASSSAFINRFDSATFLTFTIPACVAVFAIGYATAYGRKTLLARVASKSTTGARIMARLLFCAAITIWIGVPVMMKLVGVSATLVMLALSLLAIGGLLIIHEPTYSQRTRRLRLWGVYGSIAVMIILASLSINPWRSKSNTPSTILKNAVTQQLTHT